MKNNDDRVVIISIPSTKKADLEHSQDLQKASRRDDMAVKPDLFTPKVS